MKIDVDLSKLVDDVEIKNHIKKQTKEIKSLENLLARRENQIEGWKRQVEELQANQNKLVQLKRVLGEFFELREDQE